MCTRRIYCFEPGTGLHQGFMMDRSMTALSGKLFSQHPPLCFYLFMWLWGAWHRCLSYRYPVSLGLITYLTCLCSKCQKNKHSDVPCVLRGWCHGEGQRKRRRALCCLKDEAKPLCKGLDEGWRKVSHKNTITLGLFWPRASFGLNCPRIPAGSELDLQFL